MRFNKKTLSFWYANIKKVISQHFEWKESSEMEEKIQKNEVPMSTSQRRFYLLENQKGSEGAFTVQMVHTYTGKLDINALKKALNEMVRRHEILRTTFEPKGSKIIQKVHPYFEVEPIVHDLRGEVPLEEEEAYIKEQIKVPFKLDKLPLFRFLIFYTEGGFIKIVPVFHHIIWDGWTYVLFQKELTRLYSQYLNHKPIESETPRKTFREFTLVEKENEKHIDADTLNFYASYLKDHEETTLPFFKKSDSKEAENFIHLFDEHLDLQIKKVCSDIGCTKNTLLLSCFLIHLSFFSNSESVSVIIPRFSRFHPRLQKIYGPLLNTLPIVKKVSPDISFKTFVKEVGGLIKTLANMDRYSFEQILQELKTRFNQEIPPFNFLFNYLSSDWIEVMEFEGMKFIEQDWVNPATNYPMTLYMIGVKNMNFFGCHICFQNKVSSTEMTHSFIDEYFKLMRKLTALPDHPIKSFKESINPIRLESPLPEKTSASIPEIFLETVKRFPDRLAIQRGDEKTTYTDLARLTFHYFNKILNASKDSKGVIALTGRRDAKFYALMLAIMASGHTLYLLDLNIHAPTLETLMKQANPMMTIVNLPAGSQVSDRLQNPHFIEDIPLSEDFDPLDFEAFKSRMIFNEEGYLVFTSGSTGIPKGIKGSHSGLSQYVQWQRKTFDINERDVATQITGYAFDVIYREIFTPLISGAKLIIPSYDYWLDQGNFLKWLVDEKVSILHIVPSVLKALLTELKVGDALAFKELRTIFSAGEPLYSSLIYDWNRLSYTYAKFVNLYGPSETTLSKLYYPVPIEFKKGCQPLGKPMNEAEVYVMDKEFNIAPPGMTGEIVLRTRYRSHGYLSGDDSGFKINPYTNNPDDKLYFTGDLGYEDLDGNIHFLGRLDDQVKINGIRVELGAIESVLKAHPSVTTSAVILKSINGKKELIGFIQFEKDVVDPQKELELIQKYLRGRIDKNLIPKKLIPLDQIPRLPTQKIDRKALENLSLDLTEEDKTLTLPTTQTEETLFEIWQEILSKNTISTTDLHQDNGFDSLNMVQAILEVNHRFDINLKLRDILTFNTLESLAKHIDEVKKNNPKKAEEPLAKPMTIGDLKKHVPELPDFTPPKKESLFKNIFLTGATGFLGGYLLRELRMTFPESQIFCLVRAKDEKTGKERIKDSLIEANAFEEGLLDNTHIVLGNLSEPNLGMGDEPYDRLSHQIDSIFHAGAFVNFLHDFKTLKAANIDGTLEVIKFASHNYLKPISYVSTAGIFPATEETDLRKIFENHHLDFDDGIEIFGGYAQTKWVAEKTMLNAMKNGLPVSIYRVGRIGGDSLTGFWPDHDFVYSFLDTAIDLNVLPDLPVKLDLIPVDTCAKMIVQIEKRRPYTQKVYHIVNPNRLTIRELSDIFGFYKHPVDVVSYSQWKKVLEDSLRDGHTHAMTRFLELLPDNPDKLPRLRFDRNFDTQNVDEALRGTSVTFPPIDLSAFFPDLREGRKKDEMEKIKSMR